MQNVATTAQRLPADLIPLVEKARDYADQASAPNTRRAYRAAWADFEAWCQAKGAASLPADPATVGVYLSDCAGRVKVSTLQLRLVAIRQTHRLAGEHLDTSAPQIREVLKGVTRVHGRAIDKKEAATLDVVRDTVCHLLKTTTKKGLRDRAILLLGFAAALRRSELSAIDIEHVRFTAEGIVLTLPRRKTDQEGVGTEIGVPFGQDPRYCPVATLRAWIETAAITEGAAFRSISSADNVKAERLGDRDVARNIKAAVGLAGYDADIFGGHSLRAGFATTAGRAGVPERIIMLQTGHKSLPVLRGYIRRGALFTENAAAMIGL